MNPGISEFGFDDRQRFAQRFEFESEILFSDDFGRLSAADDAETMTFAKGIGLRFRNT